jgi:hypothetical protein
LESFPLFILIAKTLHPDFHIPTLGTEQFPAQVTQVHTGPTVCVGWKFLGKIQNLHEQNLSLHLRFRWEDV